MPMRVTLQGAVEVNFAVVKRDYGDCLLAYVDLHSKHAILDCVGSSDVDGPILYLVADENTQNIDEKKPRDSVTVIEFHEHKRWRVFCANISRYTISITLVAPEI